MLLCVSHSSGSFSYALLSKADVNHVLYFPRTQAVSAPTEEPFHRETTRIDYVAHRVLYKIDSFHTSGTRHSFIHCFIAHHKDIKSKGTLCSQSKIWTELGDTCGTENIENLVTVISMASNCNFRWHCFCSKRKAKSTHNVGLSTLNHTLATTVLNASGAQSCRIMVNIYVVGIHCIWAS